MLKRNWLYIAAVGGCLAALLGPCKAQNDDAPPTAKAEQRQESANRGLPLLPQKSDEVAGAGYYERGCETPKQREDDDLCQQIRMADAAERAVFWAKLQTGLGAAGFVAVVVSLAFTGWAAYAAGRAAKAAEASIHLTQDNARKELRAYLVPKNCTLRYEHGQPIATVTVTNSGQTPAEGVKMAGAIYIIERPTTFAIVTWDENVSKGIVGRDRDIRLEARKKKPITSTEVEGLENGTHTLVVAGDLEYTDIFGNNWVKNFEFATGGLYGPAIKDGPMSVSAKDLRETQKI